MRRSAATLSGVQTSRRFRIWFDGGVPVHAESRKQSGFDAALGVVNLDKGRFRFDPQPVQVEATMNCSVTELLMEGCRLIDEQNR